MSHDTPKIRKPWEKILPDIESEISVESIDYIEENKNQIKIEDITEIKADEVVDPILKAIL